MTLRILVSIISTSFLFNVQGDSLQKADAQMCKYLCMSCNGMADFEENRCRYNLVKNNGPCFMYVKQQAAEYGSILSFFNLSRHHRTTRCSIESKHRFNKNNIEKVAKYFLKNGPEVIGSVFKAPPYNRNADYERSSQIINPLLRIMPDGNRLEKSQKSYWFKTKNNIGDLFTIDSQQFVGNPKSKQIMFNPIPQKFVTSSISQQIMINPVREQFVSQPFLLSSTPQQYISSVIPQQIIINPKSQQFSANPLSDQYVPYFSAERIKKPESKVDSINCQDKKNLEISTPMFLEQKYITNPTPNENLLFSLYQQNVAKSVSSQNTYSTIEPNRVNPSAYKNLFISSEQQNVKDTTSNQNLLFSQDVYNTQTVKPISKTENFTPKQASASSFLEERNVKDPTFKHTSILNSPNKHNLETLNLKQASTSKFSAKQNMASLNFKQIISNSPIKQLLKYPLNQLTESSPKNNGTGQCKIITQPKETMLNEEYPNVNISSSKVIIQSEETIPKLKDFSQNSLSNEELVPSILTSKISHYGRKQFVGKSKEDKPQLDAVENPQQFSILMHILNERLRHSMLGISQALQTLSKTPGIVDLISAPANLLKNLVQRLNADPQSSSSAIKESDDKLESTKDFKSNKISVKNDRNSEIIIGSQKNSEYSIPTLKFISSQ